MPVSAGRSFRPGLHRLLCAQWQIFGRCRRRTGRLQFWDFEKGETFLYRYAFGPGAWLDLLPDGRFDASPEGMRYLCYTEQGTLNSYTVEELVKEFYDPKAVQVVLEKDVK